MILTKSRKRKGQHFSQLQPDPNEVIEWDISDTLPLEDDEDDKISENGPESSDDENNEFDTSDEDMDGNEDEIDTNEIAGEIQEIDFRLHNQFAVITFKTIRDHWLGAIRGFQKKVQDLDLVSLKFYFYSAGLIF